MKPLALAALLLAVAVPPLPVSAEIANASGTQDFYVHLTDRDGRRPGQITLTKHGEPLVPPSNACAASFYGAAVVTLSRGDATLTSDPYARRPVFVVQPGCDFVEKKQTDLPSGAHTLRMRATGLFWVDKDGKEIRPSEPSTSDFRAEPALLRAQNFLDEMVYRFNRASSVPPSKLAHAADTLFELHAWLQRIAAGRLTAELGTLAPSVRQLDQLAQDASLEALDQFAACEQEAFAERFVRAFGRCVRVASQLRSIDRALRLANQLADAVNHGGGWGGGGHVIRPR